MQQPIFDHFQKRIELTMALAELCSEQLPAAVQLLSERLLAGGRVFVYSDPSISRLAEATEDFLLFGDKLPRPPFPATALGRNPTEQFRQFACQQDILLLLTAENPSVQRAELLTEASRTGSASLELSNSPVSTEPLAQYTVSLNSGDIETGALVNSQLEALQCLFNLLDHQIFGAQ